MDNYSLDIFILNQIREIFPKFSLGHRTEDFNICFGHSDNEGNFLFQLKHVFSDCSE